jgi:hypothetical protein
MRAAIHFHGSFAMPHTRFTSISTAVLGFAALALILTACSSDAADTGMPLGLGPAVASRGGGGVKLPTCSGSSDCAAGPLVCTGEDQTATVAPTVITDYSNGLSSDDRGPYVQATDGVGYSVVTTVATLSLDKASKSVKNPRLYTVNLDNPVPGGGGLPLGSITDGSGDINIEVQWYRAGDTRQNLHNIPIGTTVTANQIDLTFHINGHFHILQMGPQPYGHCHSAPTAVVGNGTSSGTIYRASATKWVIDLPAGSVGRLFDLYNTDQYAVDRGLYSTQLHLEIGN